MRARTVLLLVLIPLVAIVAILVFRRFVPLGPPDKSQLTRLQASLKSPKPAPAPELRSLVGVVFTVPAASGSISSLTLKPVRTRRNAVITPPAAIELQGALNRKGLYLTVQAIDGTFLTLVPLVDPFVVRTENLDASGPAAHILRTPENALASRVPYTKLGRLSLFETDGTGQVSRLYFNFLLEPISPPTGGVNYKLVTG